MASNAHKIRFVHCPGCRQILPELPDIPVYRCGGCDRILQAKKRGGGGESSQSKTVETNPIQNGEVGHISDGNESITSSQQLTVCSTDANVSDVDHGREQAIPGNVNGSLLEGERNADLVSSSGELNHIQKANSEAIAGNERESNENESKDTISKGLSSDEEPDGNKSRCSIYGSPVGTNGSFQSNTGEDNSSSDEHEEKYRQLDHHISDQMIPGVEMERTEEPINHSIAPGNVPDTELGRTLGTLTKSQTRSSRAYDASVSSYGGDGFDEHGPERHPNASKRSLLKPQKDVDFIDTKAWPTGEVALANGRIGISSDSEVIHSVRNWMESEKEGLYRFPSRDSRSRWGSPSVYQKGGPSNYRHEELLASPDSYASDRLDYLENNRIELLKKVEELRDQLSWSYGHKEKDRLSRRSLQQENQWPSLNDSNHLRRELLPQYSRNYHWEPQRSYVLRKNMPHQPGSLQVPIVGAATGIKFHVDHPCPHCYHEGWQLPAHLPPSICHGSGLCQACPAHMCCHPYSSGSSGQQSHSDSSFPLHYHNPRPREPRIIDHETTKLHHKQKRQPAKRHCLPVSGGSPFVVCNFCWNVLQLPADFLLLRRKSQKLRCSSCSQVLAFSFHGKSHAIPSTRTEKRHHLSEVSRVINNASISHADGILQGDPVSYSDDYELSYSKSYSTEGELVLSAPPIQVTGGGISARKQTETGHPKRPSQGRRRKVISAHSEDEPENEKEETESLAVNVTTPNEVSPLHWLMGYSTVSQVLRGPRGGHESENLQNHVENTSSGSGTRFPPHKDLETGTLTRSEATSENDGSLSKSRNPRDSNFPGLVRKGLKELNHGLEIMKHKIHVNGKVSPDQLVRKAED